MAAGGERLFFGVWLLEGAYVLMDNSASVCMETVLMDSAGYLYILSISISISIHDVKLGCVWRESWESWNMKWQIDMTKNILYTSMKFIRNKNLKSKHKT